MKVAYYCRVDSNKNEETTRTALEQQRRELDAYVQAQGLKLQGCYEDAGFSAQDMNRPGLRKLITDYGMGKFDTVLCVKADRLYRGNLWAQPGFLFPVKYVRD